MAINHYQLLGIPEDADFKRIKIAYRSLAKRFHPDTNKGSEAASELFRKINDAYRILGDDQLRRGYDQQINKTRATAATQQSTAKKQNTTPDPQQKFNRFMDSLFEAIFETPDISPKEETPKHRAPSTKPQPRKVPAKPDFNFYYYLAKEQSASSYACGKDGIYRRQKSAREPPGRNHFGQVPGGSAVMLLLSGLWDLFR